MGIPVCHDRGMHPAFGWGDHPCHYHRFGCGRAHHRQSPCSGCSHCPGHHHGDFFHSEIRHQGGGPIVRSHHAGLVHHAGDTGITADHQVSHHPQSTQSLLRILFPDPLSARFPVAGSCVPLYHRCRRTLFRPGPLRTEKYPDLLELRKNHPVTELLRPGSLDPDQCRLCERMDQPLLCHHALLVPDLRDRHCYGSGNHCQPGYDHRILHVDQ